MKKLFLFFIVIFSAGSCLYSQQNVQYTQFMLNDYGLNPGVTGNSRGIMFMVGRRVQWSGFENAPETNFASVTYAFGKKGYKRYWHGVGAYIEQDKTGIFSNKAVAGSYAIHLKASSKYYLGFGISAGLKSFAATNSIYNSEDPALMNRENKVVIPEITPGLFLYSKKLFAGISVRNLYGNRLKQGDRTIGTGSRLVPVTYFSVGRKFVSPGYDFIFVPALQVQTTISLPVANFNCMVYYRKRVGLGVTYRMHDAVCAMVQFRIFSNIVVGFAYDYTISKFKAAKANSTEIMAGFSPVMSNENYDKPDGAADCPRFEL
ncbi:MAG: Bacteroidetes-specific putative rane protein [Bacteroidota bacterium]|jgi:type IX secretion system PorP/SprF family membrane protein|nr:Bacteroidetes-specific putative rane protein [Bacteroidota bacterium]